MCSSDLSLPLPTCARTCWANGCPCRSFTAWNMPMPLMSLFISILTLFTGILFYINRSSLPVCKQKRGFPGFGKLPVVFPLLPAPCLEIIDRLHHPCNLNSIFHQPCYFRNRAVGKWCLKCQHPRNCCISPSFPF